MSLTDEGKIEGYLGLYSGTPLRQFTAVAGNYVVLGRVTVSPFGKIGTTEYPYISESPVPLRLSFTVQGYYGKITSGTENFDPDSFEFSFTPSMNPTRKGTVGADLFLQGSRFMAFAEAISSTPRRATVLRATTQPAPGGRSACCWSRAGSISPCVATGSIPAPACRTFGR